MPNTKLIDYQLVKYKLQRVECPFLIQWMYAYGLSELKCAGFKYYKILLQKNDIV